MTNLSKTLKFALIISLFAIGGGLIPNELASVTASDQQSAKLTVDSGAVVLPGQNSGVPSAEPTTAKFILTKEQSQRPYSYALGKLLGQKARGSGYPADEFSIITTANKDGTYTVEIPAGRATNTQVQAVLDDPIPEQPAIVETRQDELLEFLAVDTITLRQMAELMRIERGLQ